MKLHRMLFLAFALSTMVDGQQANKHINKVSWPIPKQCTSKTPCQFVVYRSDGVCDSAKTWQKIATTKPQQSSYFDKKLPPNTLFAYVVRTSQTKSGVPVLSEPTKCINLTTKPD
jgi:hypothetical protein